MRLLILIGSLRSASFSRKLAHAAEEFARDDVHVEIVDGRELPLYDQDLDGDEKPRAVRAMLNRVAAADGLLFITPEFNYGVPGTLKNLIDWASRPVFASPLKGRPSMVIALSPAPTGGARAHTQLVTILGGTLAPVFSAPSFLVGSVHEKFDESGGLTDEITRLRLAKELEKFLAWAEANPP